MATHSCLEHLLLYLDLETSERPQGSVLGEDTEQGPEAHLAESLLNYACNSAAAQDNEVQGSSNHVNQIVC